MFGRRKTMKRKIALVCMAALTGTMLITACGSNETGKNVTASDGKAKVRFATWDVADDLDAQQKLVDKFNEEHDDIEVFRWRSEESLHGGSCW